MDLSDLNLNFRFDKNLREYPEDPTGFSTAIERLKQNLSQVNDVKEEVKILGQLGGYCRCLKRYNEAHEHLEKALVLIAENSLGKTWEISNRIRQAHVFHWQNKFAISNPLFDEIVEECRASEEAGIYLDFAYQHRGKNYFDQSNYESALKDFYSALLIRNKKADLSLVDSTLLAIEITKQKALQQVDDIIVDELLGDRELPAFIKEYVGKNEEASDRRVNCIGAALNCFAEPQDYSFSLIKPVDFIEVLKKDFEQFSLREDLRGGDLVVFWTRQQGGEWDGLDILVKNMDPREENFPYGLIFDHVAFVVTEDIVFNKPNPLPQSPYKFDYLETAGMPAQLGYGFEMTFHRRTY